MLMETGGMISPGTGVTDDGNSPILGSKLMPTARVNMCS